MMLASSFRLDRNISCRTVRFSAEEAAHLALLQSTAPNLARISPVSTLMLSTHGLFISTWTLDQLPQIYYVGSFTQLNWFQAQKQHHTTPAPSSMPLLHRLCHL